MKNDVTCGRFEVHIPLREGALTVRVEQLEIHLETSAECESRYLELLDQVFDQIDRLVETLGGVRA